MLNFSIITHHFFFSLHVGNYFCNYLHFLLFSFHLYGENTSFCFSSTLLLLYIFFLNYAHIYFFFIFKFSSLFSFFPSFLFSLLIFYIIVATVSNSAFSPLRLMFTLQLASSTTWLVLLWTRISSSWWWTVIFSISKHVYALLWLYGDLYNVLSL